MKPKPLGNMNYACTKPETSNSTISFSAEAGSKIKFSFASVIEDGELDIILYDSDGNQVYELDRAKELETFFTLDDTDTYTLAAEYQDFVGNFHVKVFIAD